MSRSVTTPIGQFATSTIGISPPWFWTIIQLPLIEAWCSASNTPDLRQDASDQPHVHWLRPLGLNRPRVAPPVPIQRDEWPAPGGMIHVDVNPLGPIGCIGHRIHGDRRRASPGSAGNTWHVAVDDHSRIAYVEIR